MPIERLLLSVLDGLSHPILGVKGAFVGHHGSAVQIHEAGQERHERHPGIEAKERQKKPKTQTREK